MELYPQFSSLSSLHEAWSRVRTRSRAPGSDGVTPAAFAPDAGPALARLADELATGRYRPLLLRRLRLPRPAGGHRVLALACVRDRVVQTSLLLRLTPLVEPLLSPAAYAYRPGRGHVAALARVRALHRTGLEWAARADVADFFPSVRPGRCLATLREVAGMDAPTLELVRRWLRQVRGLAVGSPLSPLLSNLYLTAFDHTLQEVGYRHVRYADDLVVCCSSSIEAQHALDAIGEALQVCCLRINAERTAPVSVSAGYRFLGAEISSATISSSARRHGQAQGPLRAPTRAPARPRPDCPTLPEPSPPPRSDRPPVRRPAQSEVLGPRTLYVDTQGACVRRRGERLLVAQRDRGLLLSIPAREVRAVVALGGVGVTPQAMELLLERGAPVAFCTRTGRPRAIVEAAGVTEPALVRAQVTASGDPAVALRHARVIVAARIDNVRMVLSRVRRRTGDEATRIELAALLRRLRRSEHRALASESLAELRGVEGAASRTAFSGLRIRLRAAGVSMGPRSARPAGDLVNALLSLGYSLLRGRTEMLVRIHGLYPGAAFLHADRHGHPALASDLIEPFRWLVEGLVATMLNRRAIRPEHATYEGGTWRLERDAVRMFVGGLERRLAHACGPDAAGNASTYGAAMEQQVVSLRHDLLGSGRFAPFRLRPTVCRPDS